MFLVLIFASFSALAVAICKLTFFLTATKTRKKKKKSYLMITIFSLLFLLIFLLFVVLKVNGIDISTQKTYTSWIGGFLIGFMVVMAVISIIKLRGALKKNDIMVVGLKEIIYISALSDLVIIENYAHGMFLHYQKDHIVFNIIDQYFALAMGVFMLMVAISMFVSYFRCKVVNKMEFNFSI